LAKCAPLKLIIVSPPLLILGHSRGRSYSRCIPNENMRQSCSDASPPQKHAFLLSGASPGTPAKSVPAKLIEVAYRKLPGGFGPGGQKLPHSVPPPPGAAVHPGTWPGRSVLDLALCGGARQWPVQSAPPDVPRAAPQSAGVWWAPCPLAWQSLERHPQGPLRRATATSERPAGASRP
jgi:hypothetical protein